MNHSAFFDTNVLVYADDTLSPEKQRTAIELFSRHRRQKNAILSLQVLQEYFSAATWQQSSHNIRLSYFRARESFSSKRAT
jgi:predicted nucleic acid-binding protein